MFWTPREDSEFLKTEIDKLTKQKKYYEKQARRILDEYEKLQDEFDALETSYKYLESHTDHGKKSAELQKEVITLKEDIKELKYSRDNCLERAEKVREYCSGVIKYNTDEAVLTHIKAIQEKIRKTDIVWRI